MAVAGNHVKGEQSVCALQEVCGFFAHNATIMIPQGADSHAWQVVGLMWQGMCMVGGCWHGRMCGRGCVADTMR